ncbi:uncharacterized protein LOC128666985 [Bombina bombina]|uniref:uncharacterized protein LOC128666985 n=1 Tax=Bombina bombina TaxID=8345 RepID=UPI00235ADFB8|nr:uncharacterized protein LOC128666985 [Bombina bombina]XP_053577807.1 uncharacterized protein LOC128666985 [Bombina bombina]XP_053577808.1 uncharacterized protein LOC128666985 [Bombina bombina]
MTEKYETPETYMLTGEEEIEFDEGGDYFSEEEEWDSFNDEQREDEDDDDEMMMVNYKTLRSLVKDHKARDQKYSDIAKWKVRERAERYTLEEKEVLIREVMAREDILWNKNPSSRERSKAWREITAAVCKVGRIRAVASVKHRFHDCRLEVKKKMAQEACGKELKFAPWEELLRHHLAKIPIMDIIKQTAHHHSNAKDRKMPARKYSEVTRWKERERAERYTAEEKELLVREVLAREDVLWNKNPSSRERTKAWQEITAAVCRMGRTRPVSSVKHRFLDCRLEVKRKLEKAANGKEVTFFSWEEPLKGHLARTMAADAEEPSVPQPEATATTRPAERDYVTKRINLYFTATKPRSLPRQQLAQVVVMDTGGYSPQPSEESQDDQEEEYQQSESL